jgi:very-short-patch-repair endonuclease
MLAYGKNLKEPARTLRKEMTNAEQALWSRLRRKQILGIQFYRQKPIGPYIVDFYAPAVKLVIEADGSQHQEHEQIENDAVRNAFLKEYGLLMLRFDNRQVLTETDTVIEAIFQKCRERLPPPFEKGGPGGICLTAENQIPLNPPFPKGGFENP